MTSLLPVPPDQDASAVSALARLPAAGLGVPELDADPAWRLVLNDTTPDDVAVVERRWSR